MAMKLKINALAISKSNWEKDIRNLYRKFEEHCMKYQLWHTDVLIKELYAYSKPWGENRLKMNNKYPTKKMMLNIIMEYLEGERKYKNMLFRNYLDFKDDYPSIEFGKIDSSKKYEAYMKFLNEWLSYLEKGELCYNMQICKELCKKYL